ncbi:MAG: hypothetical protein ACI9TV_001824 [Sulfurimonas sp.]|jgi:hypothetical protein|uniref:BatD family protein n=1 Tax=Sulfurimonas sp. TaxID=2022749 RepID=UPI0039E43090
MMKNLGKIFFLLTILSQILFANVVASVDSDHVSFGEVVSYNLTLSGDDVKRPEIFTLCGEDVVSTGSATSIQIVNGDYQKSYVLSYKFVPTASCTIDPISVEVGGKTYLTQAIDIVVEKTVTSKNDDFSLFLSVNKEEVYVGEPFELTLLFRQKKSAQVVDNKFSQPEFKGFWVKGQPKQEILKDKEYINTKIIYKMAPQREGNLHISPAQIAIASRKNVKNYYGGLFPEVKWKTYFSNDLNISAKALPNGVSIVGNFTIEAFADKTQVNPNEVVNVTLKITGDGNLEDIKTFKPYIEGVSVFDEKILIKDNVLTQKITFVADSSFEVPSFSIEAFDPQNKEIKTLATDTIKITINSSIVSKKEELIIKKGDKPGEVVEKVVIQTKKLDILWIVAIFLGGLILGIGLMLLKPLLTYERKSKFNLKDYKMLLIKLMPFKEHTDVKELVDTLEANLYQDSSKEIDKKLIKEIIKKYEII